MRRTSRTAVYGSRRPAAGRRACWRRTAGRKRLWWMCQVGSWAGRGAGSGDS